MAKKISSTKEEEILVAPSAPAEDLADQSEDAPYEAPMNLDDQEIIDENGEKREKYYEAIGRRKAATARVRLLTKKSSDVQKDENKAIVVVNGKAYTEYFAVGRLQSVVESPFKKLKSMNRFKASVLIHGGGIAGQADAIKFGLSRALILFDPNFAKKLRRAGFLTRDARVKERRKYGLKKARKAPQWSKR